MQGDWPRVRFGDVVCVLTGFPFKSEHYTLGADGVRLLRGDNVAQGALRWEQVKCWPHERTHEVSGYSLQPDDVVLAMDRPWIDAGLKYAHVRDADLPCLLVQRVARLRACAGLDQRFLRYVVGSRSFTDHVLAVQTGTTVPHISARQIEDYAFALPPLAEQRRIARTLGALDDKIELNRRMNETLEAMARALFKSWFVDFDPVRAKTEGRAPQGMDAATAALFPDRLEDSALGPIPAGWRVLPLDGIARFLNGLALQKYPPSGDLSLPVIKIAELRRGVTESSDRASADIPADYVVNDGDLLFSWSGSLEALIWTGGQGALNQHLFKVTTAYYPQWFVFHWILEHLPWFQSIAASKATTMGHIQRRHLHEAMVALPSADVLQRASAVIGPLVARSVANSLECRSLAAVRDLSLPALLVGAELNPTFPIVHCGGE